MEFDIDGKKVEGSFTVETLVVYEQEFGRDLVQDYYGRPTEDEDDGSVIFDFTKTNWTTITKVMWAAIKTANPKTKPYQKWVKGKTGLNLYDSALKIFEAVQDGLFRPSPARPSEGNGER